MTHRIAVLSLTALLFPAIASAQPTTEGSLHWDELSWTEIGAAIRAGKTTVIVPTGAIEDKGPHMAVSQHSVTVRYAAGEIAKRLGNALVAPLITYAPNGDIAPTPTGHMRMMSSLTMPTALYAQFVEWVARSPRFHGITDIAFIWDSGGNAAGIRLAAERLKQGMGRHRRACSPRRRLLRLDVGVRGMAQGPGRNRRSDRAAGRHNADIRSDGRRPPPPPAPQVCNGRTTRDGGKWRHRRPAARNGCIRA